MIGRVDGRSFFFMEDRASGQGSAVTLVDRVPKITLAPGRVDLGRYPVRMISPFRPSSVLVVDNVTGIFGMMGTL